MKPAPFSWHRAASLEEAVAVLAGDEDAKALAGGQSLLPLLSLRLARPSILVDLEGVGLDGVALAGEGNGGQLVVGAMVRQRRLELDPLVNSSVPLLTDAARHVGFPATRNRGTLGGSLAHADPVAELPAVAVALGAETNEPAGARDHRRPSRNCGPTWQPCSDQQPSSERCDGGPGRTDREAGWVPDPAAWATAEPDPMT